MIGESKIPGVLSKYGGILENRVRVTLETIEAVRNAVGNDYPISVRLVGSDYREGGNTIEDVIKAASREIVLEWIWRLEGNHEKTFT